MDRCSVRHPAAALLGGLMARHPRPLSRVTTRRTAYHRHHPWFMTYAYCSTGAALWTIATVWRVIA